MIELVSDALLYLRNFGNAIRLSTLQIYSSTIVFIPAAKAKFHKHYANVASNESGVNALIYWDVTANFRRA